MRAPRDIGTASAGLENWVAAIRRESSAVLFDATRLISRRRCAVATGIDRIDLRLARAFLDAFGEDCRFVAKMRKRAVLVDRPLALRLVESLETVWFGEGAMDSNLVHEIDFSGVAESLGAWTRSRCRSGLTWYFRSALIILVNSMIAGRRPVRTAPATAYVVASHSGLPRTAGALAALRSTGVCRFHAYVHDIIPIEYPEYTRPGQGEVLEGYLAELASVGAAFAANSKDTANRLTKHAGQAGWSAGEVSVAYPESIPVPEGVAAAHTADLPPTHGCAPYFVIVGTIEPRKNHLLLLNIWRDLVQSGQKPMPHLHIVGRRGWENENIVDMLDRCEAIRPYVTEHDALPDCELRKLLLGAQALLMPSFAEGLGLPVIEALQLDVPVIASDLPVFREVAGESVAYLDPLDAVGWRNAIMDIMVKLQVKEAASSRCPPSRHARKVAE